MGVVTGIECRRRLERASSPRSSAIATSGGRCMEALSWAMQAVADIAGLPARLMPAKAHLQKQASADAHEAEFRRWIWQNCRWACAHLHPDARGLLDQELMWQGK